MKTFQKSTMYWIWSTDLSPATIEHLRSRAHYITTEDRPKQDKDFLVEIGDIDIDEANKELVNLAQQFQNGYLRVSFPG